MRFGVIGTGSFADGCHIPGLAAHPEVELVGVWGRNSEKSAAVAARHGIDAVVELDALLEKAEAVTIAVAAEAQPELAVRAAEAGCHVLLEKPLALTSEENRLIVDAVDRAGVASVVNFTWRFMEPNRTWFHEVVIPSQWHAATATLVAPVFVPGSPYEGRTSTPTETLWGAACHMVALLLPAFGPVADVVAVDGPPSGTIHVALKHEDGGVSSTTVSLTARSEAAHFSYAFWGAERFALAPSQTPGDRPFANAVSALIAAAESSTPDPCDARFGAAVGDVLLAAEAYLNSSNA